MQSRDSYWWKFVEDLEDLYILSSTVYKDDQDGYLYMKFQEISDYIHGFSHATSHMGVIYGFKAIPKEQNILYSGSLTGTFQLFDPSLLQGYSELSLSGAINYDINCINPEFQPSSSGRLTLSPGTIYYNGTVYDRGIQNNTSTSSTEKIEIVPPTDLKNVLITSSVYYDGSQFRNTFLNSSGYPIGQAHDTIMTLENINLGWYHEKIYDASVFPQIADVINIAKVIWRIGTTEDSPELEGNDHSIYEYYVIDNRSSYGYYGWKQIEGLALISRMYGAMNQTITMEDVIKAMWSYVFNEMSWGSGGFIAYWTGLGKTISSTIQDLYTELYE